MDEGQEVVKRLEKAQAFNEQNQVRREFGLREMKIVIRRCLHCKQLFESIENRTCGCLKNRSDIGVLGWDD